MKLFFVVGNGSYEQKVSLISAINAISAKRIFIDTMNTHKDMNLYRDITSEDIIVTEIHTPISNIEALLVEASYIE